MTMHPPDPRSGSAPAAGPATPRYALILKTYAWDAFVARQLARYRAVVGEGDLFVSVDETAGPVGPIPHDRVLRTSNAALLRLGLADRHERGSLIWWNADYPHYQFFLAHPGYSHYVFVEYDSLITRGVDGFVREVAARGGDFVAVPNPSIEDWYWTPLHQGIYDGPISGSLNCITVFSNAAMRLLMRRRLEMSARTDIAFWPINEVFLATEVVRAGLAFLPLGDFGDTARYDWAPPVLEEDLAALPPTTFIHPVLDRGRYVRRLLTTGVRLLDYLSPRSALRRELARCGGVPAHALLQAAWRFHHGRRR